MSAEHTVWLHSTQAKPSQLAKHRLARAVREAGRLLAEHRTLGECADVVDVAINDGYAWVGSAKTPEAAAAAANAGQQLATPDGRFDVNKTPEWLQARTNALRGLSPEESIAKIAPAPKDDPVVKDYYRQCYESGYVLLATGGGNPLAAMAQASALQRTTGDPALWADVIASYIQAFPWLAAHAEKLP